MSQNCLLFNCPMCRNVLRNPITVECGHTFCLNCLQNQHNNQCHVCLSEIIPHSGINILVQHLLEKWRERNKIVTDVDHLIPKTEDLLGIEPRYHLRSGYVGLHLKEETNERLLNIQTKSNEEPSLDHKNEPNYTDIISNSFKSFWVDGYIGTYKNFEKTMHEVYREVSNIKGDAMKTSWQCVTVNDVECILCSRCLLDPVTTGCGHTFCRGCLARVLDHGLACPLCMTKLNFIDYFRGTTEILQDAMKFIVPEDFNERLSLSIKENMILETGDDIPVFICTNAFPTVACPLFVYEPKYRLLARRCLQSPIKRFAMAARDSSGDKFVSYGTVLEVRDAICMNDGRFILTTIGIRRFEVITRSEHDGYDTAKIKYMEDSYVPVEKLQELAELHAKVFHKASRWIRILRPRVVSEVERLIGKMPKVERNWYKLPDGPAWMWWLMPILPLSCTLQVGFLSSTSLEKRLRAIDKMLEHMNIRMREAIEENAVKRARQVDPRDVCRIPEDQQLTNQR